MPGLRPLRLPLPRLERFIDTRPPLDSYPRRPRNNFREMRPMSDCWEYTGALTRKGYGHVSLDGETGRAHILVYEEYYGPVPDGRMLDHLCHTRACYNPDHLEPVTNQVNTQRGVLWRQRYG